MIGKTLSHYEIVEKIGKGGMGVVYRARDTALDRDVAVKVLAERVAGSPDRIARFEREAKAIAKLSHSNILGIFDFGSQEGTTYAVTELLEGESLRQALNRDGSLPVQRALSIARATAAGLAAAHSKRIIHRDIKPGNIFLTADGGVKILDFGLARSEPESMIETMAPDEAGPGLTTPGVILGTMGYMSPEQARGQPATPASDVFSLGCALYEMLTGIAPFKRETQTDTLSAVLKEDPPALDIAEQQIPRNLQRVVLKALEKDPGKRYPSGVELEQALAEVEQELAPPPAALRSLLKVITTPRTLIPAVVVLTVIGVLLGRWLQRQSKVDWARQVAIQEITRLADELQFGEAFALAEEAEQYIPSDPVLDGLWSRFSNTANVETDPPGATVSLKGYDDLEGDWRVLGETPINDVRIPLGVLRWRIALDGHESRELARRVLNPASEVRVDSSGLVSPGDPSVNFVVTLDPAGSLPEGMVSVEGGTYSQMSLRGMPIGVPVTLKRFLIDRTEVTNREYKGFVEAGGYERPEFWTEEFVRNGQPLPFNEAMSHFRDSTGQAGPATWELGDYREGEEDYPVGGVSWFEAAAYCESRDKSLPTVFHWGTAALASFEILESISPSIIAQSNFGGEGPAPVGSLPGISVWGVSDMAGNLREWCWNGSGDKRASLGGAWSDPTYAFTETWVQPPWDRLPVNGFRCAKYVGGEPDDRLKASRQKPPPPDYYGAPAVSDAVFKALMSGAVYRRGPLNAEVESEGASPFGGREVWVDVDAAYPDERLPLRLHLPDHGDPPYQAVVWFPGAMVLYHRSIRDDDPGPPLDVFIKSGRAVVQPIYAGTYERNDGRTLQRLRSPSYTRQLLNQWIQDIGRTLDYLEERQDIEATKVAYVGTSLGANGVAYRILAFERRFRAAVLWSGGFSTPATPESLIEIVDAVRRITVPVLMINGRYDYVYPYETHQKPAFDLLGTPPEHKRHVVFNAGHAPFPRAEFIKENLAWLDKYLGPVERAAQ